MLDVIRKVIVEGLLPDSQCGFRKGCGCVDMIFVARQLMEKMFVDMKKAYDSDQGGLVCCNLSRRTSFSQTLFPLPQHKKKKAVSHVRLKCGVPPTMVNVIHSFHEGMQAGKYCLEV